MTAKQINEMKFLARVIETIKMTTATRAHESSQGWDYADKYDKDELYDLIFVPVPEDKYFYDKFIKAVMLRANNFGVLDGSYIINFCTEKICNILLYNE